MKYAQHLGVFFLVLVILVGILPAQAFAVAEYGSPTADPEELVIDYSKTVQIEEVNLRKHIQLNGGASAPVLQGVVTGTSYTNGQLLTSKPSGIGCTSANTSMSTTFGTVQRTSTHLSYTPTKFLTGIERFYAVYSFTGFSKFLLVEIRIIPAAQVYYEAENFVNTQITTMHTTNGGTTNTPWSSKTDSTNTATTTQNFDQVGHADFDMLIDRMNVPTGAFFADFDGTGLAARYSKYSVYGGYDFDSADCWFGSKGRDTDEIKLTPGQLVIPVVPENNYHYVQCVTTTGDGTSSPLSLHPSKDDFLEVRFRTVGVKSKSVPTDNTTPTEPFLKLTLGTSYTENIGGTPLEVILDYNALVAGEFITARIPLGDWDYYTSASVVYKFRFYVNGIYYNDGGKMILDYLYIGSSSEQIALPPSTPTDRNFLFFGFDAATDKAFYDGCSIDGTLDYSQVSNWYSDAYSCGSNGYGSLTINTAAPGTMSFSDGRTYGTDAQYNVVHPGTTAGAIPLSYKTTDIDYFKIRFKVIGGSGVSGKIPVVCFEYRKATGDYSSSAGYAYNMGDTWQEIVFDINIAKDTVLTNIRPAFGNTQGCTFIIDYFALFPSTLLTDSQSSLFFDYGTAPTELQYAFENFAQHIYYQPNTNTKISKDVDGIVMEDNTPTAGSSETGNNTRIYYWLNNLNLIPADNHYFQARVKIEKASGASAVTATTTDGGTGPWFDVYIKNAAGGAGYAEEKYRYPINLNTDLGKWITVTIPITNSNYNTSNTIVSIVPALRGTQGAKVTIDYIYVGPPITTTTTSSAPNDFSGEANPVSRSLYFGFDNDETDKLRYLSGNDYYNDTYTNINYDAGNNWVTSSYYSGSANAFTVNNTNGIVSLQASTKDVGGKTKGPYFVTTKTKGQFVIDSATQSSLKYHPQFAEIFQIRFRLNGCSMTTTATQVPELVLLFGGYDKANEFVHHETTVVYPYMTGMYHDTDEFQTVTIALPKSIRNLSLMTNFGVRFWRVQGGTIDIDYIYIGPRSDSPNPVSTTQKLIYVPTDIPHADSVYSYDETYANDTQLSNGKSMFVQGNGVRVENDTNAKQYTEASFTFTGTGFDIISRTGAQQGAIRVEVRKAADNTVVRTMSVNNKGDLELYQIPVVSINGLPHGTYHVTVGVNKALSYGVIGGVDMSFMNRGNEFYFDAIRIYDTINIKGGNATGSNLTKDQKITLNAYRMDNEAFPFVREIRDTLLSATEFSNGKNYTSAALFIDTKKVTAGQFAPDDIAISSNLALNVATYDKLGPKNEIYLSPGQAVAFKLNWGTGTPVGIDVGAKTVLSSNGSAVLAAGFVTSVNLSSQNPASITKTVKTINTATPLYYPLDISGVSSGSYLVLYNASTGTDKTKNILSLTDLKVCYTFEPSNLPKENTGETGYSVESKPSARTTEITEPYRFEVDESVTRAAALFLGSFCETPVEEKPVIDESLKIYHSLNLDSDISVNFIVPATSLESYDSFFMELTVHDYEGNELLGQAMKQPEPELIGGNYYFTLSDLNATRMNDRITATLHLTKDGQEYSSLTDVYSIAQYAYSQLEKTESSHDLKTLCADLLVYGTKAQLYKNYRTDSLGDGAMTEEQRAYCSDLETVVFGNTNVSGTETEAPAVTWIGKALELNSRVSVIYCVDISGYEGELADLTMKVSYLDRKGEEAVVTLRDPVLYGGRENCYKFTLDSLLAAELRSVLTAQVYGGDTAVSNSLTYSPDTYGNNKTGALGELCKALFAYSDAAKAYFSN